MFKIFIILAFLVKFPIYSVHLWLPKAHVEAPVSGSIILAGVLLKLGGYGIIRFYFINDYSINLYIFCGLTLMGASLLSMLCMVNSDIKVVIAYSSVVHMALVIRGLLSLSL
jgi:NADH-ubiquinone oxidoreductase chain 4